jgi:hypothetical protein
VKRTGVKATPASPAALRRAASATSHAIHGAGRSGLLRSAQDARNNQSADKRQRGIPTSFPHPRASGYPASAMSQAG